MKDASAPQAQRGSTAMSKTRVLITDGLAKNGVDILKATSDFEVDLRKATPPKELAEIIGGYEAIIIRSATTLTQDLIEKASSMKLIVRAGAGVDNIDVQTATARNIPVMNTSKANSLAAAEQTIGLMFSMLRMIPQSMLSLRQGKWDRDSFKGFEATGKTLGVIGLGNIGCLVAEKAIGLGMKVLGYDPNYPPPSVAHGKFAQLGRSFMLAPSIDEVISAADIVTVHVPKKKDTLNLIDSDRIAKMKDQSFVINCSRGGIVDERAVIAACDSGKLRGAAFDVFENEPPVFPNPIFMHPKIVCVPHLGAATFEAQDRVALTAASQTVAFFSHGDRTGIIN